MSFLSVIEFIELAAEIMFSRLESRKTALKSNSVNTKPIQRETQVVLNLGNAKNGDSSQNQVKGWFISRNLIQ